MKPNDSFASSTVSPLQRTLPVPRPKVRAQAVDGQLEVEHVAGTHDAAEAHAVDAGEERHAPAEVRVREHAHRARLRERLDHQHAGHDRLAGKVPAQEPFVAAHREARTHTRARLQLDDLVDQQERVAVRDDLLDLLAAEWAR